MSNVRGRGLSMEKITLIEKYRLFSETCEYVRWIASKEGYRTDKFPDEIYQWIAIGVFGVWYQKHMILHRGETDVSILLL